MATRKRSSDKYQDTREVQETNGENTKAAARGQSNKSPMLRAGNRGRIEYVTMDLTEATRRFPRPYGAAWLYPEVV